MFAWVFRTSWPKMGCLGGQNRGTGQTGGAILTPNELILRFRGSYVCANFGENDQEMRPCECPHTDRYTDIHNDWRKPILSSVPCYRPLAMGQIIIRR